MNQRQKDLAATHYECSRCEFYGCYTEHLTNSDQLIESSNCPGCGMILHVFGFYTLQVPRCEAW